MKKGFTLTETIVVLVIVFFLTLMVVPAYQQVKKQEMNKKHRRGERSYYEPTYHTVTEIVIDGKRYELTPK